LARLYANENFPLPVVNELRRLGHDVLTTHEAGRSGKAVPDTEVVAFAISESRAVVAINRRDFVRLHRLSADHEGIIVCSEDVDFEGQGQRIHDTVGSTELRGATHSCEPAIRAVRRSRVDKVRLYYDDFGKTLTVWLGNPADEVTCNEADDDTILIKDGAGHVIGFEKLNVHLPAGSAGLTVEVVSDRPPCES